MVPKILLVEHQEDGGILLAVGLPCSRNFLQIKITGPDVGELQRCLLPSRANYGPEKVPVRVEVV